MPEQLALDLGVVSAALDDIATQVYRSVDTLKLDYARGLISKAQRYLGEDRKPLSARLLAKVEQVVDDLERNIAHAHAKAETSLRHIEEDFSGAYEQACSLYESGSLKELQHLYKQLQYTPSSHFGVLINELNRDRVGIVQGSDTNQTINRHSLGETQDSSAKVPLPQYQLQSFKQYQSMFEKMSLDRLLAKVMKEIPENAGPLNPERLVIRSFKALQDISPEYLTRIISYYESLLTLQLVNVNEK